MAEDPYNVCAQLASAASRHLGLPDAVVTWELYRESPGAVFRAQVRFTGEVAVSPDILWGIRDDLRDRQLAAYLRQALVQAVENWHAEATS